MNEVQEAYARFADKDINVLSITSLGDSQWVYIHVEYMFRRPRDGKVIWPHIIAVSDSLIGALKDAEKIVDGIRGE